MKAPPDFVRLDPGVLVRRGHEEDLAVWRAPGSDCQAETFGGRGTTVRMAMADGADVYIRRYRHGGVLGALLRDVYFGWPPRSWRELEVTEAARSSGIHVPEVLAAVAEPLRPSSARVPYRGILVTRAIPERRPLAQALKEATQRMISGILMQKRTTLKERRPRQRTLARELLQDQQLPGIPYFQYITPLQFDHLFYYKQLIHA